MVSLLTCKIQDGIVLNEKAVYFNGLGIQHETEANDIHLVYENQKTFLKIEVIIEAGDRYLIQLPRQLVSGYRRVWVMKSEVIKDSLCFSLLKRLKNLFQKIN